MSVNNLRRFIWIILGSWLLAVLAISSAIQPFWSHPCQRPILLKTRSNGFNYYLIDVQTGVFIQQERDTSLSPDGHFRYIVNSGAANQSDIYIHSLADDSSQLLYSTNNTVRVFWSADSQRLFVQEGESTGQVLLNGDRLFSIEIATASIRREYGATVYAPVLSPDNRLLYVTLPNPTLPSTRLAAIETITGEMAQFDPILPFSFHTWSPDNQWLALRNTNQTYIVAAATGTFHPILRQSIEGAVSQWTNHSLWMRQNNIENRFDVWQIVLETGSMTRTYQNAIGFRVSSQDRWRMIWYTDNNNRISANLHDSMTDTIYPDLPLFDIDFSSDERCLLALPYLENSTVFRLEAYDLETMALIFDHGTDEYGIFADAGITTGTVQWDEGE